MDFKNATNQQLYDIAMNESNRLRDRYAATVVLQRRKKEKK
jgi:hypothetical protein